jgi:hypothetical protein
MRGQTALERWRWQMRSRRVPKARAVGLEVWVDQRPHGANRLIGGAPWQEQLENAIAQDSTAFGLLLTRGARTSP